MGALVFGSIGLGLIIGVIFSLLFVSFDAGWRKMLSVVFTCGASGGGSWGLYKLAGISDSDECLIGIGILAIHFWMHLLCFC